MAKKKKLKNKKRITRVVILAIIVILSIAGIYEAYAYFFLPESNAPIEVNNDPVKYNIVGSKPLNISPREIDKTNKVPIDAGEGKVGIPELGIKLRLPEDLKGLVYYFRDINNHQFVEFSTATLSNSGIFCVASEGPIGGFSRIEKTEVTNDPKESWYRQEKYFQKYSHEWKDTSGVIMQPTVKELDTFYILYTDPQAVCSDEKSVIEMESEQIKLLQETISSIEKL